ncbi:putative serine/arginine-rich splicing factor RS2Z33-like isoform X1 [Capsicum annuum]|nr:putative serine/arginine-rich splicing factor RS2Z33-like isoform X1 [Capsicum annuum]
MDTSLIHVQSSYIEMMKNNFFFRSSTNDTNKTPSPPLKSKEVSSWRSVSLSSGSFYDSGSGKENFTDLRKYPPGHTKKVHPKKSGHDSSQGLSVPVLIRTIRRLIKERYKWRLKFQACYEIKLLKGILLRKKPAYYRLRERARELAEQNVSLQRKVSSFNEKEVDNTIRMSFSEKHLEDLSKRIEQVSEDNQNLRQQLTQLQAEYRVAQDNRYYVRENYQKKVKEIKSETLLTTVLREKLYSEEMDIKQLQADLAATVRGNDILKYEVRNALDALFYATPNLKYLELQERRQC